MIATSPILSPNRLCWIALIGICVAAGLFIPLSIDLKTQLRILIPLGVAGLLTLTVLPNRRIALVCAWVLAHPLSLEKVFPLFGPTHRGLMGSMLVVSGSDLVLYTLVAVVLFEAWTSGRPVVVWTRALTVWSLLLAWAVLVFFVMHPTTTGIMQLVHWTKMLVYLAVFSSAIRSRDELLTVLVAAAAAVLIQSAIVGTSFALKRKIGFSSKVTSEAMMSFSSGDEEGSLIRATGTVGQVNQQAMFHTFFTIPLIGLLMVRNRIWKAIAAIVLAASFCAVILTFSRASWISWSVAGIVVLAVAWKNGRINRVGWLAICCGALVALAGVGAFSGMIVKRLTKGDDGASSSRIRMALLALDHAESHPLTGVGPGNFINAQLDQESIDWGRNVWLPRGYDYRPRYLAGLELYEVELQGHWYYMPGVVHNKLLLMAAELGLVGLALFLWFQWEVLRQIRRALQTKDRLLWWIGLGLLAAFCANQSEFMFELFYDDKTVLMPLFVDALALGLARLVREENAEAASA